MNFLEAMKEAKAGCIVRLGESEYTFWGEEEILNWRDATDGMGAEWKQAPVFGMDIEETDWEVVYRPLRPAAKAAPAAD